VLYAGIAAGSGISWLLLQVTHTQLQRRPWRNTLTDHPRLFRVSPASLPQVAAAFSPDLQFYPPLFALLVAALAGADVAFRQGKGLKLASAGLERLVLRDAGTILSGPGGGGDRRDTSHSPHTPLCPLPPASCQSVRTTWTEQPSWWGTCWASRASASAQTSRKP